MKHVKLFEHFLNEANTTVDDFIKKNKNAKTLTVNELVSLNVYGVISARIVMGRDEKTHAVGSGTHHYITANHPMKITKIEVHPFNEELYKKIGVKKSEWKKIQKEGGLLNIKFDTDTVTEEAIARPLWFETFSTIS